MYIAIILKEKILLDKIKKQFEFELSKNDRNFFEYYAHYNRKIIYGYTSKYYCYQLFIYKYF